MKTVNPLDHGFFPLVKSNNKSRENSEVSEVVQTKKPVSQKPFHETLTKKQIEQKKSTALSNREKSFENENKCNTTQKNLLQDTGNNKTATSKNVHETVSDQNRAAKQSVMDRPYRLSPDVKAFVTDSNLAMEALQRIADLVNINIDGLAIVNTRLNEDSCKACAEIIDALSQLITFLNQSEKSGSPIEFQGAELAKTSVKELENALRKELFAFQVGLEAMGSAGDVMRFVSQKQEASISQAGIPVATEVRSLQTPQIEYLDQLFVDDSSFEEQVKKVIQQLTELGASKKDVSMPSQPIETSEVLKAQHPDFAVPGNKKNFVSEVQESTQKNPQLLPQVSMQQDTECINPPQDPNASTEEKTFSNGSTDTYQILKGLITNEKETEQTEPKLHTNQTQMSAILDLSKQIATLTEAKIRTQTPESSKGFNPAFIEQVVQKVTHAIRNGIHEVKMSLKPEHLGQMHMKIQLEGDILTGKISVETIQVKQMLESSLQLLKDTLEHYQIKPGHFEISIDQQLKDGPHTEDGNQPKHAHQENTPIPGSMEDNGSSESAESVIQGTDTGRRFGYNSIELLA